jgi:NAD(P)H-flavin reductase
MVVDPVDPMVPRFERVHRVHRDGADVWTLEIEPAGGFEFLPGQFNMLYAHGVGEAAISISGDSSEPGRLVHTIRAVGRVSEALTRLETGDPIGIRGPFGRGWPMEEAEGKDVVVVAGGLGVAPLRPAIHLLLHARERYRRVVLLVGMRGPKEILLQPDLERWRGKFDVELELTVDHAGPDWHGNVGVVTTLIPRAEFDPVNTVALVCGPELMMRFAIADLARVGIPDHRIYLSMERNMKCAVGLCGHCQFSGSFVCKDGPVYSYDQVRELLGMREI